MGVLYKPQYEVYAQARAAGMSTMDAYLKAGYSGKYGGSQLESRPEVRARIKELQTQSANRVELTRKDILDRILQDWETSRKLGQMASALKAGHMLGSELYKMFIDRKEIGQAGDFDSKTEDELRQIVRDGLKDLGWEEETANQPPSTPTVN